MVRIGKRKRPYEWQKSRLGLQAHWKSAIRMKRVVSGILVLSLITVLSCSQKSHPGHSGRSESREYDSATFSYFYGEALKQKILGNAGDALKYLEQCIKINPLSDAAFYQIAQISVQHGDFENGKAFAKRAYEIEKGNLWYMTMLGDIYLQEKKLDSAALYYDKAVLAFPENDQLKMTAGSIYSEKGDFGKAADIYSGLERKYGTGNNVTVLAVRNLLNAGQVDEAEEKVQYVLNDNPENILFNGILAEIYKNKGDRKRAEVIYEKLMNIDSSNIRTIGSLTDFLLEGKEYDDCLKLVNGILIGDQFSRDDIISLFSKLLDNGELIRQKGTEIDVMLRVLENSHSSDPVIVMIRPELYQKLGRAEDAANRLEEIIVRFPDNYMAWERLLLLYSDMRKYDRLLVLGKECSTKFNMSYVAKVLYASAAMEKKQYDIALDELNKAKILSGSQDELVAQVLSMQADIYYRKKEFAKSFETFREILKKNPEDMIVLNNYAYFLAEQNQDLKEAERMIRIVIEKEKSNGTYLDTYAWVLFKRGKFKEASKVMEELMAKDKNEDSEWFEHYGFMMKALKRCDIAVDYWKRAVQVDSTKDYLKKEIESCTK
jgi:predicted Zn-dependent protease